MPPKKDNTSSDDTMASMVESLQQLIQTSNANTDKIIASQKSQLDVIVLQLAAQYEQNSNLITTFSKASSSNNQETPPPPPPPPQPTPRPPKITLPMFDGSNPLDWVFQADNYFGYYSIPPAQRVTLSAFHFIGKALSWYKHLANNHLLGPWPEFTRAIEVRFGPSTYENHQATLFKLRQTSTVSAYQTEFEQISNCVNGLSNEALRNCFISGLNTDIQSEIALHNPTTLHQTYGLAKLIEDKLHVQLPASDGPLEPPPTNPPLLAAPPPSPPTLPIKRLSPVEMQKRRAEGLCFNCPEKYHRGHQCNPPQFLLLQTAMDPPWKLVDTDVGLEDKANF